MPASKFLDNNREEIERAGAFIYKYSPSFWFHRNPQVEIDNFSLIREKQSADIFRNLSAKAKYEMTFIEFYKTGFTPFLKKFYKTDFWSYSSSSLVQAIFFGYRFVLIILGFFSCSS